nr:MAG TPA: hypothetical protein [Caudoviricetes sp.]
MSVTQGKKVVSLTLKKPGNQELFSKQKEPQ